MIAHGHDQPVNEYLFRVPPRALCSAIFYPHERSVRAAKNWHHHVGGHTRCQRRRPSHVGEQHRYVLGGQESPFRQEDNTVDDLPVGLLTTSTKHWSGHCGHGTDHPWCSWDS